MLHSPPRPYKVIVVEIAKLVNALIPSRARQVQYLRAVLMMANPITRS